MQIANSSKPVTLYSLDIIISEALSDQQDLITFEERRKVENTINLINCSHHLGWIVAAKKYGTIPISNK